MTKQTRFLLVANWDSDVGFAWWLMESYWVTIAQSRLTERSPVLAYPSISEIPAPIDRAPIEIEQFSFEGTSLPEIIRQIRFLRKHEISDIYFTDKSPVQLRFAAFRMAGVKHIIVHDHTPGLRTRPGGLKRLLKAIVARLPWINADAIIGATAFVSERHRNVLCIPPSRCYTARNGLAPLSEVTVRDVREEFSIGHEKRVVVMTSRAVPYKGIDFVLECIQRHNKRKDLPPIHFVLLGDGPYLGNLKRNVINLNIENDVTLAGYCDHVSSLLPSCDFAIHASLGEVGYSLAIIEYMRAGLPVIVPDNPSVCEATKHRVNGLVYRERDVNDACAAMAELVTDQELARCLSERARSDSNQYTLAESHRQLLAALASVTGRELEHPNDQKLSA